MEARADKARPSVLRLELDPMREPQAPSRPGLVKRHSAVVRLTHWLNALCLVLLLMSGLQIFNAPPAR